MLDFWPLEQITPSLNFDKNGRLKMVEANMEKQVRFSNGVWAYEASTSKGIDISVKCNCGKIHKIHLGSDLFVEPKAKDDLSDCIDCEILEEADCEESTGGSTGGT